MGDLLGVGGVAGAPSTTDLGGHGTVIRVLVVDDHELLRGGVSSVLGTDPGIEVVGQAGDGVSALAAAVRLRPDVVLMDVQMPGGDGITATTTILRDCPEARVIVLTMFDLDDYVLGALRAGASGFLLKTTPPDEVIAAVKSVAAGEASFGPSIIERLVESYVRTAPASPPPSLRTLTARELEVLTAMAEGLSNAEIGQRLYLAETTVKTHVGRVLSKLGVRDRLQAVVIAHRVGLARD